MITLNLEALRHVLEGLSSGFRPTATDILVFGLAVAGFVGLLVLLYLLQRQRIARGRRRRASEAFDAVVRRQGLTEGEKATLRSMLQVSGGGEEEMQRLVTRPGAFNRASREYLAAFPAAETAVAALRFKLDFGRFDGAGPIHSTAELGEPGLRLYVREADRSSGHAHLAAAGPEGLVVQMDPEDPVPRPGETVQLFFPRADGIYFFTTRVRRARGTELELDHSERVARVQRRRYARSGVSIPARVRPMDPPVPPVQTYVVELGGGGATLFDPHGTLRERRRVQLELALPEPEVVARGPSWAGPPASVEDRSDRRPLRLSARVVRVSRKSSRVHVEFDPMGEADRDRIMRHVLSRQTVRPGVR
jgi:c-di-GMP-binding flagellar brake protein YcgR